MPTINLSQAYTYKGQLFHPKDNPQEVPEELAERDKELSGAGGTPSVGSPEAGADATEVQGGEETEGQAEEETMGGTEAGPAEPTEPAPSEEELPDDFPHVSMLRDANFTTFESIEGTNLRGIPGIGKERAEDIAEALEQRRQEI